jgi:hypothetical protein
VQRPDRAIQGLALQLDPGQGMAARHLVGDAAQGDDVVGGDAAGAGHEEAAAEVVVATKSPTAIRGHRMRGGGDLTRRRGRVWLSAAAVRSKKTKQNRSVARRA